MGARVRPLRIVNEDRDGTRAFGASLTRRARRGDLSGGRER